MCEKFKKNRFLNEQGTNIQTSEPLRGTLYNV